MFRISLYVLNPAQMAMDSMMGGVGSVGPMSTMGALTGLGGSPAGVQLVRDPASGTLLLMPTTGMYFETFININVFLFLNSILFVEQFQQAVVWGGYGGVGVGVGVGPVLLPPPMAPLQLLGAELLTASTIHHTQTHSTRLVALTADPKRPKQAIVKFDDCSPQISEAGLLVYQLGDCRSQVGTPIIPVPQPMAPPVQAPSAPCLTPPPDGAAPDVQDASNQTDTPTPSEEDENPSSQSMFNGSDNAVEDTKSFSFVPQKLSENVKSHIITESVINNEDSTIVHTKQESKTCNTLNFGSALVTCDTMVTSTNTNIKILNTSADTAGFGPKYSEVTHESSNDNLMVIVQPEVLSDPSSNGASSGGLVIDSEQNISPETSMEVPSLIPPKSGPVLEKQIDLSGLELLSNSIEQFETRSKSLESSNHRLPVLDMPSLIDHQSTSALSVDVKNSLHPPPLIVIKTSPKSPKSVMDNNNSHFTFSPPKLYESNQFEENNSLGGLSLLCALAERHFMEEVGEKKSSSNSFESIENTNEKVLLKNIKKEKVDKSYSDDFLKVKPKVEYGSTSSKLDNDTYVENRNNKFDYRRNSDDHCSYKLGYYTSNKNKNSDTRIRLCDKKYKDTAPVRTFAERKSFEKTKKDNKTFKSSFQQFRSSFSCNDELDTFDSYNDKTKASSKSTYRSTDNRMCDDLNVNDVRNTEELNMMKKLADIKRKYKEAQREFIKLTPKKLTDEPAKRGPGRPRKKSTPSEPSISATCIESRDKPIYTTKPSLPKIDSSLNECSKLQISPLNYIKSEDEHSINEHARSVSPIADSNSSQSSVATLGSSKKRKVGRPKKLLSTPGSHIATETIVAKKPKSKNSLVGYLLAAKGKLNMPQNKGGIIYSKTNPPRPHEDDNSKKIYNKVSKNLKLKSSHKSGDNNGYSSPASSLSEFYPVGYDVKQKYASLISGETTNTVSKMRPKLKAEPKLKDYSEEDDVNDWCNSQTNLTQTKSQSSSLESLQEIHLKNKIKTDQLALKHKKNLPKVTCPKKRSFDDFYESSDSEHGKAAKKRKENKFPDIVEPPKTEIPQPVQVNKGRCALSLDQLDNGGIRVLTAMGGLFYAGCLKAIRAPDVYAVTLDGERGNRPHFLSREEALQDAVSFYIIQNIICFNTKFIIIARFFYYLL